MISVIVSYLPYEDLQFIHQYQPSCNFGLMCIGGVCRSPAQRSASHAAVLSFQTELYAL